LRGVVTAADPTGAPAGTLAGGAHGELGSALERLLAAEARQRQLVQSVQAIVWRSDPRTFGFTFVSRQAQTLLGYPVARWTEDAGFLRSHVHRDDLAHTLAALENAVRERRDQDVEFRMRSHDGRDVWLQAFVRVVCAGEEVKELVGVMVDV